MGVFSRTAGLSPRKLNASLCSRLLQFAPVSDCCEGQRVQNSSKSLPARSPLINGGQKFPESSHIFSLPSRFFFPTSVRLSHRQWSHTE
ncbi:hypothetical protein RRG08_016084 [Elysia crispata]|uniref:Uncharacterized protein n=1 Tax=Elysia crispata TaxID=231223 RepID=A0AAE0ZND5_9GAST|nr:hypothetical protein RRG08_016084 [Elysia crispata]